MSTSPVKSIALMVRSRPFEHRASRPDPDIALAAAALDFVLEIYFLGDAVMQLADQREVSAALLPPGYRAWAALPELADVRVYAERRWLNRCSEKGISLILPVEGLTASEMQEGWRRCRFAMEL